ncbi:Aste57867_12025 [Aphanomyces stellatus]|uniref:Aste57867_12025 protein n=1 Tax=Aphanomyces stellatus TaxID=120398 RepID=A0A485KVP9_9STRA|nr:hypothetical protein As57867_011980 [Aphanomyces stellatus]VFT88880.1 Aste57867_12025 [Aphanomyces stellatus]
MGPRKRVGSAAGQLTEVAPESSRRKTTLRGGAVRLEDYWLPPDLMERVARFVPDDETFFRLLEAFNRTGILSDALQAIWTLSKKTMERDELWPNLMMPKMLPPAIIRGIPIAARYYDEVHFEHLSDVDAIVNAIPLTTSVVWFNAIQSMAIPRPWTSFCDRLSTLHITHLSEEMCDAGRMDLVLDVLPRLPHLRTLSLIFCSVHAISPFTRYIRDSKLTRLTFEGMPIEDEESDDESDDDTWVINDDRERSRITEADVDCLTHWLTHNPVVLFEWAAFRLPVTQPCVSQFLDALFGCDTLTTFGQESLDIPNLASYEFRHPNLLSKMSIRWCDLSRDRFGALCRGLDKAPRLTELDLSHLDIDDGGILNVFERLPNLNIRTLEVASNEIDDDACTVLAELLPTTCIRRLDLSHNRISNKGALALAKAIPKSPRLIELNLKENRILKKGLDALVKACGSRVNLSS